MIVGDAEIAASLTVHLLQASDETVEGLRAKPHLESCSGEIAVEPGHDRTAGRAVHHDLRVRRITHRYCLDLFPANDLSSEEASNPDPGDADVDACTRCAVRKAKPGAMIAVLSAPDHPCAAMPTIIIRTMAAMTG